MVVSGLLVVAALIAGCGPGDDGGWQPPPATTAPDVAFDAFLKEGTLPAIAVAVVDGGDTQFRKVAGVRKQGDVTPVAETDAFHIGSNTKAMTSLLIGTAVDAGQLTWDTTIAAVLTDTIAVGEAYRNVTVSQLLSHTSGLPDSLKPADWNSFFGTTAPVAAERRRMAELALARPPASAAGTAYLYSNFNYVVAGLMLEVVTGQSWETLMSTRLFVPLGMLHAGFGPPAMPGLIDAPWGHNGMPVDPASPYADNPLAIGPAGTVHASLDDILAYVPLYFDDGVGPTGRIVSTDVLAEMATPRLMSYGLGWVVQQDSAGRTVLLHDGSNTMFLALFVLVPARRAAIIVLTNAGDNNAMARVNQLGTYLVQHYQF
jgi:CubicO group peptidase (beta-lactamase class C family)